MYGLLAYADDPVKGPKPRTPASVKTLSQEPRLRGQAKTKALIVSAGPSLPAVSAAFPRIYPAGQSGGPAGPVEQGPPAAAGK